MTHKMSFLRKLKIELPFDPGIPLLGIYLEMMEALVWKNTCIPMFIAALFTVASIWEQPKCPSRKRWIRASLVVQWLRIRLPMQATRVWSLVWEEPTCRGETKPVRHNYGACTLEIPSHNYWAHVPQLLKPTHLGPVLHSKRSLCNEKPMHRNKD